MVLPQSTFLPQGVPDSAMLRMREMCHVGCGATSGLGRTCLLSALYTNLRFHGFTVNCANLPNLPFYAPKPARSDRKFTILPFYGAFLGNNGIYHFTVLPFYGAPWEKTCLKPAPCTQTP